MMQKLMDKFDGLLMKLINLTTNLFTKEKQFKKILFGLAVLSILCPVNAWSTVVNLGSVPDVADTSYRWKDIADNVYQTSYQTSFTYDQTKANLTYDDFSNTFSGTLTATGLKPNFAYQMKLVGSSDIDDWTNEQLGYAGRWWYTRYDSSGNIISQGNTTDTFYDAHKGDSSYVFQGYLLFDFFVTDENGNASSSVFADSSYHVLWNILQMPRTSSDGPITATTFDPAIGTFYDTDFPIATIEIYAQWEPGRALSGALVLTPGEYTCQFILTEESFHSPPEDTLGGYWAGAMEGNVTFTVVPLPANIFLLGSGLIGLLGIRRKFKK